MDEISSGKRFAATYQPPDVLDGDRRLFWNKGEYKKDGRNSLSTSTAGQHAQELIK